MTSKLQKLSTIAKHALLFSLFIPCFAATSQAQVFPSQIRISAGADYAFLPMPQNSDGVKISPDVFLGLVMEFKQLYALRLALKGNSIEAKNNPNRKFHPTLGFTYDVILKLYRSDPPVFFTPIAEFGVSKQWSVVKTEDSLTKRVLNDMTDWQFHTFIGADLALAEKFHIKPVAGMAVILTNTGYFERRVFPVVRVSTDLWF
ncbi:MAG: hypothetical protein V4642_07595 [Bacteroidota bacterium]